MPNENAEASRKGVRRLERCLCVDPHQLIFLAPSRVVSVFVDDICWDQSGYEIDETGCRIKFDRYPGTLFGVKALVAVELSQSPQVGSRNLP